MSGIVPEYQYRILFSYPISTMAQRTSYQFRSGELLQRQEDVAEERMMQIVINGQPYTMTMCTPGDEESLTRGILHSEDVYTGMKTIRIEVGEMDLNSRSRVVQVRIPEEALGPGMANQRNLMSVSSCGMCGKYDVDLELQGDPLTTDIKLNQQFIPALFKTMRMNQPLFDAAGGTHASAAFDRRGQLLACKEDIGRHNAVDKVIGSLLMTDQRSEAIILLVSGRISYEIVSKCYRAGIPFLAAVSAPSSLAIEYCESLGITLMAFCRDDKFTVYTHVERIQ